MEINRLYPLNNNLFLYNDGTDITLDGSIPVEDILQLIDWLTQQISASSLP